MANGNLISDNNGTIIHKKTYAGIDLLKFVMALAVVAIHVKPFERSGLLSAVFKPWMAAAVPVFFLISAFLLFRKMERIKLNDKVRGGGNQWVTIIRILYLVWFVLDSPYIIANKGYFTSYGALETLGGFIKDLFLGSTFPGSWFLSALIVSVVLVYGSSQLVGKNVTFIISIIISMYVMSQNWLPESLHGLYDWYAAHVRKEVNCSFPFALVWVSMGQVMATEKAVNRIESIDKKGRLALCLMTGAAYFAMTVMASGAWYLNYILVPLFMMLGLTAQVTPSETSKFLRETSILLFLFHFSIAGKKGLFLNLIGNADIIYHILFYMIVVGVSLAFATVVLTLEKHKIFKFLKYTH